jgi:hypothetical protein
MTKLHAVCAAWEALLVRLSEAEIVAPQPDGMSIDAVLAHLMAWQQISIARLHAAQHGHEPQMPAWLGGRDPDSDDHLDAYNAQIQMLYHEWPWPEVSAAWRNGFLRFCELAAAIPANECSDTTRYPWLKGYALIDVLEGSYEHHHEHLEPLLARYP